MINKIILGGKYSKNETKKKQCGKKYGCIKMVAIVNNLISICIFIFFFTFTLIIEF